ncbi:MAG: SLC13 family permease [Massiliimalia sp.]|jgi:Na+/H+ antiporter NhaD/arsenite permease-like protein
MVTFFRKEPVLCVSAVCAVISMFLVPPSAQYIEYIDFRVLALLFCLMAVIAGLQKCGVFAVLAQKLLEGKRQLRLLYLFLVLLPFFASMLITNDVALITFVPFAVMVLELVGKQEAMIPVIVLQTIGANLGSAATPVGNPQNLFLYEQYHLSAGQFFGAVIPVAVFSLIVLTGVCLFWFSRQRLEISFPEQQHITSMKNVTVFFVLFLLCLLCVFRILPYGVLLLLVCAGLLLADRGIFRDVDYGLLATFVCFFIFAGNMGNLTPVRTVLESWMNETALYTSAAASQVISNVPAAVLLSGFTDHWKELLLGVNIGGLGTPIASLASLISFRLYMKTQGARSGKYLLFFTQANLLGLLLLFLLAQLVLL